MDDRQRWLDTLEDTLTDMRASVERVESMFNVEVGRGITASKASIDPAPLLEELEGVDASQHERLIAGYASGVKHVLLEPKRSDAAQWDFVESAGRLMPNVEVYTFALGAEAAAGSPPWTQDFYEDLIVAYFIELDRGIRVLTEEQFERWTAPAERVTAAGRSLLFHKSRNLSPEKVDGVERIHTGDGYDAMRCIVVADVFFADFDDSFRFSMPSQDAFLFVRGHTDEHLDTLRAATDAAFADAEYPLSRSIYGFSTGKPVLEESRS